MVVSAGKSGEVVGLDPDTGRVRWQRSVGTHRNDTLRTLDGPTDVYPGTYGGILTPPATADGVIYVATVNAPSKLPPDKPSYFGGELGTHDGEVVAINAVNGKVVWDTTVPGDPLGGATVVNDLVLTALLDGTVVALDRGKREGAVATQGRRRHQRLARRDRRQPLHPRRRRQTAAAPRTPTPVVVASALSSSFGRSIFVRIAALSRLETDYLVVGAGALGMAFVDSLIEHSDADVVMVERRHRPGGHWLDAYPFVQLHQPSRYYGVDSTPLGQDRLEPEGTDTDFYERASGAEICGYFDDLMRHRFLTSGRVRFFPMCDYLGDRRFRSRVTDRVTDVTVRDARGRRDVHGVAACRPPTLHRSTSPTVCAAFRSAGWRRSNIRQPGT